MIFLYFLSILENYQNIIHDCNSENNNIVTNKDKNFDYIISCSSDMIQKIDLSKVESIHSVSIFNETNVSFICHPQSFKTEKIKMIIYGNPNISFENNCHFGIIKIYGAPIFNVLQNEIDADTVIIYNDYNNLPFHPQHVIYSQNISKNQLKTMDYTQNSNKIHVCNFLEFDLSEYVTINCDSMISYTLQYQDLIYYDFHLQTGTRINSQINIKNISLDKDFDNEYLTYIMASIFIFEPVLVIYTDFCDISPMSKSIKMFQSSKSKIRMRMTWEKYMKPFIYCAWEDGVYKPEYLFLEDYFNDLIKNHFWRKTCINNDGYLYLQDETDFDFVTISTAGSWGIIVGIVVLVLAVIITSFLIAFFRYH